MKILVAGNSSALRGVLAELLESLGHTVVVAVDGATALRCGVRFRPDVFLTDSDLVGLDVFEVADFLRRLRPAMHLILLAACLTPEFEIKVAERSKNVAFLKPVDTAILLEAIQSAGRSSRPSSAWPHGAHAPFHLVSGTASTAAIPGDFHTVD